MGSRKGSAKAKKHAEFKASLSGASFGDLFDAESRRREQGAREREAALRYKACGRKNRYNSRLEAEAAIAACEDYGTRGLHCYKCAYCKGWHLTSHSYDN